MVKKERMVEKEDQEKGKLKQTKTNVQPMTKIYMIVYCFVAKNIRNQEKHC